MKGNERGGAGRTALAIAIALAVAACGGGGDGSDGVGRSAGAGSGTGGSAPAGIPVAEPDGPVDPELAARGEGLFRSKGCVACHTIGGGRQVGPDLEGVVERRDFGWTYHMVTNPDSMVRNDSIAKALLGEYFTPMSDQNIQPEEFRAIYEYLRAES